MKIRIMRIEAKTLITPVTTLRKNIKISSIDHQSGLRPNNELTSHVNKFLLVN